ncbi:MAG: caspase domain-containing protein, partial [Pseudorhodoplanes sp.]
RPLAAQEARIAFVAGYAAYPKGPLKTALNDAGLVADSLRSIGFTIVETADANKPLFQQRYEDFLTRLKEAGPSATAFVYISGYGLAIEGENYLLPSDARADRESDIAAQAIPLSQLLDPLAALPARARVFVFDAARPLPFRWPGRPLAPGLEMIQAPAGTLVGFASGPGTVIEDSPQAYGIYAAAIAEMVRSPGLDLDAIFTRIRARTHQATQGKETPWHMSAIREPAQLSPVDAAPSVPARARRSGTPMRDIGPDEAYALAIERDTLEGYADFIEAYPRHPYVRRLFQLLRSRREAMAWLRANQMNTPPAYWTYLKLYPRGLYAFDAERKLKRAGAAATAPADFTPIVFDGVPPPLSGEPEDYIGGYDDAPAPPASLIEPAAPPFQKLPPPRPRPGALPSTLALPAGLQVPPAQPVTASEPAAPSAAASRGNASRNNATPKRERRTEPPPRRPQPAPRETVPRGPGQPLSCEIVNGMRFCRW